jgi:hypothetical protein
MMRRRWGLSQSQFARLFMTSVRTVRRCERGQTEMMRSSSGYSRCCGPTSAYMGVPRSWRGLSGNSRGVQDRAVPLTFRVDDHVLRPPCNFLFAIEPGQTTRFRQTIQKTNKMAISSPFEYLGEG